MVILLVGIFVMFVLSAFFSAAEMAYVSFDKIALKSLSGEDADSFGRRMKAILKDPSRFITFVLIGNNFTLICLSSFVTIFAQHTLTNASENFIETLVIFVLTPLIVIFCELLPKNYGILYSKALCETTSPVIHFSMRLSAPLIQLFRWITDFLLLPIKSYLQTNSVFVTRGELRDIFEESFQRGEAPRHQKAMLDHVFSLEKMTVQEKMRPMTEVVKIYVDTPLEQVKELAKKTHFTRYLVYGKTPSDILGYINIYDLLFDNHETVSIRDHLRSPVFLKADMTLEKALEKLKKERERYSVVVDYQDKPIGTLVLKRLLNF